MTSRYRIAAKNDAVTIANRHVRGCTDIYLFLQYIYSSKKDSFLDTFIVFCNYF